MKNDKHVRARDIPFVLNVSDHVRKLDKQRWTLTFTQDSVDLLEPRGNKVLFVAQPYPKGESESHLLFFSYFTAIEMLLAIYLLA